MNLNRMPIISVVTNIPTPYRDFLFSCLQEKLGRANICVYFLRHSERGRHFRIQSCNYARIIFKGLYWHVMNYHLHLVPSAWRIAAYKKSDVVILGASWNDLNILIILFLIKIFAGNIHVAFWLEANIYSTRLLPLGLNQIRSMIRSFIISQADSYIVPNQHSRQTLAKWCPCSGKPVLILPNLVNTPFTLLCHPSRRIKMHNTEKLHFVMVARLDEKDKGIINFIRSVRESPFFGLMSLSIAGDGPDMLKISEFASEYENINFLGHVTEESKWSLLGSADVFVLSSFRDPCPVSIVEAASASLPLLVSDLCGNARQLCSSGVNGFLFNPYNQSTIANAFANIFRFRSALPEFGSASRLAYEKTHSPEVISANFRDHFQGLVYKNL